MSTPWRRRRPILASLAVATGAYVFFATTLMLLGGAEPEEAWGTTTAAGAAVVWFIAWAVFTRTGEEGTPFSRRATDRPDEPIGLDGPKRPDGPDRPGDRAGEPPGPTEEPPGPTEEPPRPSR
jgi:hypothetical protein